jgi:hypothetical protein
MTGHTQCRRFEVGLNPTVAGRHAYERASSTAFSRRRSFWLARRIARSTTGAAIRAKPDGSPQLRNVVRVAMPSASVHS